MALSLGEDRSINYVGYYYCQCVFCHRFYIGSKYNVVVCDIRLIEDIMTHHHDKLSCGGPYTVIKYCYITRKSKLAKQRGVYMHVYMAQL